MDVYIEEYMLNYLDVGKPIETEYMWEVITEYVLDDEVASLETRIKDLESDEAVRSVKTVSTEHGIWLNFEWKQTRYKVSLNLDEIERIIRDNYRLALTCNSNGMIFTEIDEFPI